MGPPARPLPYEPPSPAARRNAWTQQAVFWGSILVACTLASVWGKPLWHQARLIYWQHRCMIHVPAGNPRPAEWVHFGELASPPGLRGGPVQFLHELVSPAGHHRLVEVELDPVPIDPHGTHLSFDICLVEPAGWPLRAAKLTFFSKVIATQRGHGTTRPASAPLDPVALDPADPSHFRMTAGPQGTVIEGWLRNDDTVRLEWPSTPNP
jgi:hypothetical protein